MTWLQPAAWIGLGALALPILIHLLARGEARRLPFPTLRFVPPSPLLPTRRTRLDDLLLLAVRMAILFVAVAALAQPLWRSDGRRAALDRSLLRAIVVDTSASMQRPWSGSTTAVEAARDSAVRLAADADGAIIVPTVSLDAAVADATAWLVEQSGQGEVVVLSDFQVGALDSSALARVPRGIGIRLRRIGAADSGATALRTAREGARAVQVAAVAERIGTRATWSALDAPPREATRLVALGKGAEAALGAVTTVGVLEGGEDGREVVVLHGASAEGDRLRNAAAPLGAAWMLSLVNELRSATDLSATVGGGTAGMALDSAVYSPLLRGDGTTLLVAAAALRDGARERLLLVVADSASPTLTAALVAEVARRTAGGEAMSEAEPARWKDAALAAWERAPSAGGTGARGDPRTGPSDARWLWLVVLLLLGVEAWLRRAQRGVVA